MEERMREALEHIVAGYGFECERFTTGIGACFKQGKTPDSVFWSDRCCSPCIAFAGLYGDSSPLPSEGKLRKDMEE